MKWRHLNPNSKWQSALKVLSGSWDAENDNEFSKRWNEAIEAGRGCTKVQRKYIYDSNREAGRIANRIAYHKHAAKRREDAVKKRREIQSDPVLRLSRNQRDSSRKRLRLESDENLRFRYRIRTRIFMALKGYKKAFGSAELLGCSMDQARAHIESQFQSGMTWQNWKHDGWHIDHIKPCHKFDLSDPEQQRQCFNYTNLQPLWCLDNWRKDGRPAKTYRKR